MRIFGVLNLCVSLFSCIVMMSGCVRCLLVLEIVSDTVHVHLKYDDVLSFCLLLFVGVW